MPVYPFTLSGGGTGSGGGVGGFTGLEHETDHSGAGLANVLAQYVESPRLLGLLDILLDGTTTISGVTGPTGVQAVEDLAWELLTERFLHVVEGHGPAAGVNLDILGRLLGQPRPALGVGNDALYIVFLKARILVNRCNGRLEELLAILVRLDIAEAISAYEYYPAGLQTCITGVGVDPMGEAIWTVIKDAKPAGVYWHFLFSTFSESDVFTYSSVVGATETDAARGYGDLAFPPATGGHYAGMFS